MKKVLKRKNPCCFVLTCILVVVVVYCMLNPEVFTLKYKIALAHEGSQFYKFYTLIKIREEEIGRKFSDEELRFLLKVLLTKQKPEYINRSAVIKDGVLNVTLEINTFLYHRRNKITRDFNNDE